MSQQKVATEVAEHEFTRFAEMMDLDVDTAKMDEDDRKGFDQVKSVLLRAMETGRLVIDERGQPTFTTTAGETITFREPTGGVLLSMEKKQGNNATKLFVAMGEMTGQSVPFFSKMPQRDLRICTRLANLFFS